MNLEKQYKLGTLVGGSFLFITNDIQTIQPLPSKKTDYRIQEIIAENELAIITALSTHNVIWIPAENKFVRVNQEQLSFDIDGFYVLFSKIRKNYKVPAIVMMDAPHFSVYNNKGLRLYRGVIGRSELPEENFDTEKTAVVVEGARDIQFIGNTVMTNIEGKEVTFPAGSKRPIFLVFPESTQRVRISGDEFGIDELARVLGINTEADVEEVIK